MVIPTISITSEQWSAFWEILNKVDIAFGIVGFPLAILGLLKAISESRKTRTAAVAAKLAVDKFRSDITLINVISDFTIALSLMDEARRLFRHAAYAAIPDRLSEARRYLIAVRNSHQGFDEGEQVVLQDATTQLSMWEAKFEDFISKGLSRVPAMQVHLSKSVDSLQPLLIALKLKVGSE